MRLDLNPGTNYLLVAMDGNPNETSNLALDVDQASKEPGAALRVQPITGNASQQWKLVDMEDGIYRIINNNSNLPVANHDGEAVQDMMGGTTWRLIPMGEGFEGQYQIIEEDRGFSLFSPDRQGGAPVRVGPTPRIWPPFGRWQIRDSSGK